VRQLETEIAYLNANTDGLVVDIMRNPGGGCVGLRYAALLMPERFKGFSEYIRPTLAMIADMEETLALLEAFGAEKWVIETVRFELDSLRSAYRNGRGLTGAIPACSLTADNEPARTRNGDLMAYTKPLILLVDEFSTSFADAFAAMIQDNRRGLVVGARTNGAGGSVVVSPAGQYSEASVGMTNALIVRSREVRTPEFGLSALIENIGVRPDVAIEVMTRENLMQQGRPFADEFSKVMARHIRETARP